METGFPLKALHMGAWYPATVAIWNPAVAASKRYGDVVIVLGRSRLWVHPLQRKTNNSPVTTVSVTVKQIAEMMISFVPQVTYNKLFILPQNRFQYMFFN